MTSQFSKGVNANAPQGARPVAKSFGELADALKAQDSRGLTVKQAIEALNGADPDHELVIWLPNSRIRLFGKAAFKTGDRQVAFEGNVQSGSALDDAAEALKPIAVPLPGIDPVAMSRMTLAPGDTLVVQMNGVISKHTHDGVKQYFADKVPPGVTIAIVDGMVKGISIASPNVVTTEIHRPKPEREPPVGFVRDPNKVFCGLCGGAGEIMTDDPNVGPTPCPVCGGDGRAMLPTLIGIDPSFGR